VAARDYGQFDGVTRGVELIGERWALLIVRDLLVGPRRYGELATDLARIPTNILAARLKELQAAGVIRRAPRSRVVVYELTDYGRELEPIVVALGAWGFKALDAPRDEQIITPDALAVTLRAAFRPAAAAQLPTTRYATRLGHGGLLVAVTGSTLELTRDDALPDEPLGVDLSFVARPDIHLLLSGRTDAAGAIADGSVELLHGDRLLVERFAATFHLAA
jgi:DNA-binding HxlR family transcriptional regulator